MFGCPPTSGVIHPISGLSDWLNWNPHKAYTPYEGPNLGNQISRKYIVGSWREVSLYVGIKKEITLNHSFFL